MASPGLEPETFSVLDWRDNQLHHETSAGSNNYETYIIIIIFYKTVAGLRFALHK